MGVVRRFLSYQSVSQGAPTRTKSIQTRFLCTQERELYLEYRPISYHGLIRECGQRAAKMADLPHGCSALEEKHGPWHKGSERGGKARKGDSLATERARGGGGT